MEIFCRLLFGHLLADFTFQTNYIAKWKRDSYTGLLVHVAIHPVCYLVLLWPFLGDVWVTWGGWEIQGWVGIIIATLLHFLEDWFRISMVRRGWSDNSLFYVWDQGIHLLVIFFLSPTSTQPIETVWPLLGSLFVAVTHWATVTIWFIEKDTQKRV